MSGHAVAMKSCWLDESGVGASKVLLLLIAMLGFIGSPDGAQGVPRAGAPPSSFGRENGGREYVRLTEWAKANGFQLWPLKRQQTFQLSSSSAKLVFAVDSRE